MKTYKATFSMPGVCTRIPDAQTLFGAFCRGILISQGEDRLKEYLDSFESQPWLVHSSMYPDHFFPAPKQAVLTLDEIQKKIHSQTSGADKLRLLSQMKQYKKYRYVSEELFSRYVRNGKLEDLAEVLEMNGGSVKVRQEKGLSILSADKKDKKEPFEMKRVSRGRSGSLKVSGDRDLFFREELFFSGSSRLCLYLKASIAKEEVEAILKMLELTGAGPLTSTGVNGFVLESLEEMKSEPACDKVCLLSGCIPAEDEFDLEESHYDVESSLYRTSFEYAGDAFVGRFVKLEEGSIMKVLDQKEYYGQLVETQTKGKPIYHYGIGFVL